jgi:spermidine/putrescine transport system permease protein
VRIYAVAVYLFLYAPLAIIALFSFSAGRSASDFHGFSVQWYITAAGNRLVIEALLNSLLVAFTSAALATVFGSAAALMLPRVRGGFKVFYDALTYVAIMVPGIVIGISTLIALSTAFNFINPVLLDLWSGDPKAAPQLAFGFGSLICAHSLFSMALVIVIVKARLMGMDLSLIEASMDLYADPWGTFRQVTFPQIMPGVIAGFLLSFTFSLDDYVIASFVAGSRVTLPIYVFASIRRGVTPEINAIGTTVLVFSLTLLTIAQVLLRRQARKSGGEPAAAA